jgi:hypothetical protein
LWVVTLPVSLKNLPAEQKKKKTFIILAGIATWIFLQGALAYSGFYLNVESTPPRLFFAIGPPVAAIAVLFSLSSVRLAFDSMSPAFLTYLHAIRFPVEIVLWLLFQHKKIPTLMTFEGRNPDIIIGLTAPIIAYLCFTKKVLSYRVALIWHLLGATLLLNVTALFLFSVPSPFKFFDVDYPNLALFYFPFIWVVSFGVPTAFLAHFIAIKRLWRMK